jgi:hypothetical protein
MSEPGVDSLETGALELPEARRLLAVVAPHPSGVLGAGEAVGQIVRELVAEEAVEDRVGIGARRAVGFAALGGESAESFAIEEEGATWEPT